MGGIDLKVVLGRAVLGFPPPRRPRCLSSSARSAAIPPIIAKVHLGHRAHHRVYVLMRVARTAFTLAVVSTALALGAFRCSRPTPTPRPTGHSSSSGQQAPAAAARAASGSSSGRRRRQAERPNSQPLRNRGSVGAPRASGSSSASTTSFRFGGVRARASGVGVGVRWIEAGGKRPPRNAPNKRRRARRAGQTNGFARPSRRAQGASGAGAPRGGRNQVLVSSTINRLGHHQTPRESRASSPASPPARARGAWPVGAASCSRGGCASGCPLTRKRPSSATSTTTVRLDDRRASFYLSILPPVFYWFPQRRPSTLQWKLLPEARQVVGCSSRPGLTGRRVFIYESVSTATTHPAACTATRVYFHPAGAIGLRRHFSGASAPARVSPRWRFPASRTPRAWQVALEFLIRPSRRSTRANQRHRPSCPMVYGRTQFRKVRANLKVGEPQWMGRSHRWTLAVALVRASGPATRGAAPPVSRSGLAPVRNP